MLLYVELGESRFSIHKLHGARRLISLMNLHTCIATGNTLHPVRSLLLLKSKELLV